MRWLVNRQFSVFWGSQFISTLGAWIVYIVLNLYVYTYFASASVLATFLMIRLIPALVFGPVGGWLADKFSRRRLLITCDLVRALLILGFMVAHEVWVFCLLGALLVCFDKVSQATQGAYLPDLVGKEEIYEANSYMRIPISVSTVLGPALGALLIANDNYQLAFIIDSLAFLVSASTLTLIGFWGENPGRLADLAALEAKESLPEEAASSPAPSESGAEMSVFQFLGRNLDMIYMWVVRLLDCMGSGAYVIGLAILGKTFTADGSGYGWLMGCWALGTVVGSLCLARQFKEGKLPANEAFACAVVIMVGGMSLTFNLPWLGWALLTVFLGGIGDGISGLIFQSTIMQKAPDQMRGKVVGTSIAVVHTGSVLGMSIAGFVIEKYPLNLFTDWSSALIALSAIGGLATFYKFQALQTKALSKAPVEVIPSRP